MRVLGAMSSRCSEYQMRLALEAVSTKRSDYQSQRELDAGYKPAIVDAILRKVTPHVPVPAPAVKPSQQMQQALVNLNLAAAKLLSRFLPSHALAGEEEEGWRARLLDYYTGMMEAGQVLPSRSVRLLPPEQAIAKYLIVGIGQTC